MAHPVSRPKAIMLGGRRRIQVQPPSGEVVRVSSPRRRPRLLVGLDLGQRADWTALAVVEDIGQRQTLVALERVRHLEYPAVAELVRDTMLALPGAKLLVDVTGVGRPICDLLSRLRVRHTRVNIHGGTTVGRLDDGTLSVPKRDLVGSLVVGFETHRLRIAAGLPHAANLEREAAAFTMTISASGHDSYSAREGEHDHLLLAVALPVWQASRSRPCRAAAGGPANSALLMEAERLRRANQWLPSPERLARRTWDRR